MTKSFLHSLRLKRRTVVKIADSVLEEELLPYFRPLFHFPAGMDTSAPLSHTVVICTVVCRSVLNQKTGLQVIQISTWLTSQCGELCNRRCIVERSESFISWRCAVRL